MTGVQTCALPICGQSLLGRPPKCTFIQLWENLRHPRHFEERLARTFIRCTVGKMAMRLVIIVERQTDLLEIVLAFHSIRRSADALNGGEYQPDQNAEDRQHDQDFDETESRIPVLKSVR